MDDSITVSVLIPVYNIARYLRQCMESVVSQTLSNFEVICINDGSTDDSGEILKEYAQKYPFVRVINKPNSGYGNSLNIGIEVAKGKYVGIVESDDFIDPQMYLRLFEQAEHFQAEVVKANFYNYRQNNGNEFFEMLAPCPYGQIFEPVCIPQIFFGEIYLWTGLYRWDFLNEKKIRFNETPGASYQDVGFTFKIYTAAKRMLALKEGYYHYRRDNETSSVFSLGKVFCVCDEFQEIRRYLAQYPELQDRVRDIVPYMQYKRYMPTFRRIAYRYKISFLERMIKEFDELQTAGQLQPTHWLAEDWQALQNLRVTYADLLAEAQEMRYHLHGLKKDLSEGDAVYIYGAGKIGREVAQGMAAAGIKVHGFVVTTKEGNEEMVDEIPVRQVDDITHLQRQAIVIAVKLEWQFEVVENLRNHGAKNIVVIDAGMRKYLRQAMNKKYEGFGL